MEQSELNQARTNPEFLSFLEEQENKAIEESSISELYQVLDTLLVLDLDEDRVNKVYQEILKVSFDQIEDRLEEGTKLTLEGDDIFFIRSFYEHAIEKWSIGDFKGSKELFFILTQIVEDEKLIESFSIHMLNCAEGIDMDSFYENSVSHVIDENDEKYGYFITRYTFDIVDYLNSNAEKLQEQYEELKHLLN